LDHEAGRFRCFAPQRSPGALSGTKGIRQSAFKPAGAPGLSRQGLDAAGGRLELLNPNDMVTDVLVTTRVTDFITITRTHGSGP
jgi:hypothetical protein